jgi:hypothetical protein
MLAHSGDEESVGAPVHAAEAHLRRIGTLYPLATEITEQGALLQHGVQRPSLDA